MAVVKPEQLEGYESAPESIKKWIRIFGNVWPFDNREYWGDLIFAHKLRVMIGEVSEKDSPKQMVDLNRYADESPIYFSKSAQNPPKTSIDHLVYGPTTANAWERYQNGTLIDEDEAAQWFGQQLIL